MEHIEKHESTEFLKVIRQNKSLLLNHCCFYGLNFNSGYFVKTEIV